MPRELSYTTHWQSSYYIDRIPHRAHGMVLTAVVRSKDTMSVARVEIDEMAAS